MYRPPDIETSEDFSAYYRGSFIGWRNPEAEGPPFIPVHVGGTEGKTTLMTFSDRKEKLVQFKDILENAQFGTPQYGSTEVGETCVYVSRRSKRTAHRGHRSENLNGHSFHPDEISGRAGDLQSWGYMKALFNPTYRSMEEAVKSLNSGERLACSISRHFTLALVEGYKVPVLFYKTNLIGYVNDPQVIELESPDEYKTLVQESFSQLRVA